MAEDAKKKKKEISIFEDGDIKIPRDSLAEQNLLGAMLIDNEIIKTVIEHVVMEDFYFVEHRDIFSVMVEFAKTGKVDAVLVTNRLIERGHKSDRIQPYIFDIMEKTVSTASYKEYIKLVQDKSLARRLYASSKAILAKLNENRPINEILIELTKEYRFTCNRLKLADIKSIKKYLYDPPEYVVELDINGKTCVLQMEWKDLETPSNFASKVASTSDHMPIIPATKQEWQLFIGEILTKVEKIHVLDDMEGHANERHLIADYVKEFLDNFQHTEDKADLLTMPVIYANETKVMFKLSTIEDYLTRLGHKGITWKQIARVLKEQNGNSKVHTINNTCIRLWEVPYSKKTKEITSPEPAKSIVEEPSEQEEIDLFEDIDL